jgi:hypothetical protein
MNSISDLFIIFAIVVLLCIVPAQRQYEMIDKLVYTQSNVITSKFQSDVSKQGYIDREMYENFIKRLADTGRSYDITFVHRQINYYPLKATDPGYTVEKPWTVLALEHPDREILKKIYDKAAPNNKIYKMNIGDDFKVTVQDKNLSSGSIFKSWINRKGSKSWVYASYGGAIQNEGS